MGKNKSRKRGKIWVCREGCKMTSIPCTHLEKLITVRTKEPNFESVNRYAGNNIDQSYYDSGAGFIIPKGIKDRSYEFQFRRKLEKAGLEQIKVDVLVLRFVYDFSMRQIAEELGVISATTVLRLLSDSLKHLKGRINK